MRKYVLTLLVTLTCIGAGMMFLVMNHQNQLAIAQEKEVKNETVKLPAPKYDGNVSVEKTLKERRSVRSYQDEPLTLAEVSQILWSAQGITDSTTGHRTAPSARAMYLINVYLLPGKVTGLPMGLYKYQPQGHELLKIADGDMKTKLFDAAGQAPIKNAPAALIITGLADRSKDPNWMYLESGHVAQNIYLQGVSLKLGTVVMAGFKPEEVAKALSLPKNEQLIYIMPLGRK